VLSRKSALLTGKLPIKSTYISYTYSVLENGRGASFAALSQKPTADTPLERLVIIMINIILVIIFTVIGIFLAFVPQGSLSEPLAGGLRSLSFGSNCSKD